MKKKPNVRAGEKSVLKKICTVMKLCLFLLLITIYSVSAESVAQNVRLSMEKKSESLVKVLNELVVVNRSINPVSSWEDPSLTADEYSVIEIPVNGCW